MGIFDKRVEMKPYEYPEALEFMKALRGTMWFIDEFRESLKRDVTDYKYNLSETERGVIKRALIAISQIEVSVKTFWGKIGDKMPKAEIYKTGITCAHNEVIHEEAYSELLTELGIEDEFSLALQEPCIHQYHYIFYPHEVLPSYRKPSGNYPRDNICSNVWFWAFCWPRDIVIRDGRFLWQVASRRY